MTFLLVLSATKQDMLNSMNAFCAKANFEETKLSPREWDDQRSVRENRFYQKYPQVIDFAKDQSKVGEFISAFTPEAVLMFILAALIIIGLIVFSIHCCCNVFTTKNKMAYWMPISAVLLLVFFLLFIVFTVFIAMTQYKYDSVICLVYRLPGGMVEGYQDQYSQFVGIKGLLSTYKGFSDELNQLVAKKTSF